jgi:outer membrane receptor protein involved in Fe transport
MVSLRSTRNPGRFVLAAMMALLLCGIAVAQQETGQIAGTVKDQSGAVIAGATVVVKNLGTSQERTVTTGASGNYTVTNLQPSKYLVTATQKGFAAAKTQIEVSVGTKVSADFTLEVGSATTVIEGAGSAEQVNVESQVIMDVVNSNQIEQLPTLTRNPYDLVSISGNVASDPESNRGTGYSINGQRSASTNMLLDGADNNDLFIAGVGQQVPLDSVQEFSVVSSSFTAEYGRASGGVINVATKSGSNTFHGSAYEFNRVSALASNGYDNNAFDIPRQVFTRNQFGYSVGGPIVKDKLFFFNNTEWFRIRSGGTTTVLVPTDQLIATSAQPTKDFFSLYGKLKSGLILGKTYTKGDISNLCPSTGICAGLPSTMPVWQTVSYPVPKDVGGGLPRNEYQTVIRGDYNMSANTTMYGRYSLQSQDYFVGTNGESPYQGFDSGSTTWNQNWLYSLTHTFSPKLVSQFKATFNRLTNEQPLGDQPNNATLYLSSGSTTSTIMGLDVALPGYLPYSPGNGIPSGGPQNLGELQEDVSWIKGNHTFRFGGSYIYLRDNRMFGAYAYAIEQLGSNTASGMENFLKGQERTFTAAVYPQGKYPGDTLTLPVGPPDSTRSNRYHDFSLYAQDTWRVAPRWTVNLGLRWEYYGVQHNKDPKKDSNFYLGTGSKIEDQFKTGKVAIAPNSSYNGLWTKDLNNFAPRVGVAWDVFGNGKTSLRGGYGISYERNFGNVTFNVIQNPPNYATVNINATDVPGGILPIYTTKEGPLSGSSGTKVLPASSLRAVNEHIKNAYAHFWSAAIEHEITRNLVGSLEYSGSKGVGLYGINRENLPGSYEYYNKVNDGGLKYYNTQYAVINYRTAGGTSDYNAMIASLSSRGFFENSLQFTFAYTWSHSIDNLSSTFSDSSNNYNLGFMDPRDPQLDRGDSDYDVRHRVAISGIWNMPFARNTHGVSKQILDGWSLTPILTFNTGSPYTVWDSTNCYYVCNRLLMVAPGTSLTGSSQPKEVGDVPNSFKFVDLSAQAAGSGDNAYYNQYTGTSDFGPYPATMTRRNAFRRPGNYDITLGIYKNFPIKGEQYKLQFRSEFYNLFNHANLYVKGSAADFWAQDYVPASRGVSSTSLERRNIQFALKFIF